MKNSINNILIIIYRNIGDVLLSTILLENLKHYFPNSKIDYAINKECKDGIKNNPFINKIYAYDRKKIKPLPFLKRFQEEIKYIKQIIKNNYDLIFNLTEGDRGTFISLLSSAKIKIGVESRNILFKVFKPYNYFINDKISQHTAIKYLSFLNAMNLKPAKFNINFFFDDKSNKKIENLLKNKNITNFIVVHPVSRWMFKSWESEKFAKTIDYIQRNMNLKVIITGSPSKKELKKCNDIVSLCKTSPLNLAGKLTLIELGALISKAKFYFGVDTAPMHMAAALNIPVIALMGGSNVKIWGPWNNGKILTYEFIDGVQKKGIHTVISRTNHTIFYENGIKKSKGMSDITTKEVIEILKELK